MSYELYHHGIRGQHWGVRHGPPYPLKGGSAGKRDAKTYKKRVIAWRDIYNKRHIDKTISTKDTLTTLSFDKNRTTDTDMFYAAYDKWDKHEYNALLNKKVEQPIYDKDGNMIGTGKFYKFRINNNVNKDIKVASEDSGTDAFINLYKNNRDFYNFVTDPERMQKHFDKYITSSRKHVYDKYVKTLKKVQENPEIELKPKEAADLYRVFNYILPSDGGKNAGDAKDIATQRASIFKELKKNGYGAMLDTNDSIYGGFKSKAPVIVFDMESISLGDVARVSALDHRISELAFFGKKALGL